MTETAQRTDPGPAYPRAVRMYNDAWRKMNAREHGLKADTSQFTRDMTEAGLGYARCSRCFELVPVEFGDLAGRSLAEWVDEAREVVRAQHRAGHHPVTIGNGAGGEGAKAAPGSAVFLEPGGKAAVTPVPQARDHSTRKGRRS